MASLSGAVAPENPRTQRTQERGVLHPDFAVGANVHQPHEALQQRRPDPPLVRYERELIVLDLPAVGVDLIDQRPVRLPRSSQSLLIPQQREQHRDQAPGVGHELLVDPGLRFDVQPDPIPHEPVLGRPVLPLPVAVCGLWRVVDGEVVALVPRKQRDAHHRDAGLVQLPDNAGPLGAEIGQHDHDPGPERSKVIDHRAVLEQRRQARCVQLTGEGQARPRYPLGHVTIPVQGAPVAGPWWRTAVHQPLNHRMRPNHLFDGATPLAGRHEPSIPACHNGLSLAVRSTLDPIIPRRAMCRGAADPQRSRAQQPPRASSGRPLRAY